MINNILKYLLIILFFLLPLVNSHFFDTLGLKWGFYVSGNFEFSKVIFFNIISSLIIILFFIQKLFKKIIHKNEDQILFIPKIISGLIGIILISTIFSDFFYTSLLGNASKSHSAIMFINLIGLFLILINSSKLLLKTLLKTTLISSLFVAIMGFKEYFIPTFDYGDLGNRAFSTFGHPNYLALFVLILTPFLYSKISKKVKLANILNLFLFILLIILLILTKSAWGILVCIIYIFYKLITNNTFRINKKFKILYIIIGLSLLSFLIIKFGLTTKLHSFLSRFFIWETTLKIIFSDIKNVLIGSGSGTLEYVFNNFKSPFLYIFENIGFTADRPHNLLLNFFYHFGLYGLFFIIYLTYKLIKNYKLKNNENKIYHESLFLFFLFTIFNFPSISHYIVIILIGSFIYKKSYNYKRSYFYKHLTVFTLILTSIFGTYFSINYYKEEHKKYTDKSYISSNILYNNISFENYKQDLFGDGFTNIQNMCSDLISNYPSVENNFYCGDSLWKIDKKLAINYYNKGLEKLPDLWNTNSKYNDNYIIKKFVDKKRFFSEKYSNLNQILERVGIENK